MKHVWHSAPAAASNCKQGLLMMTLPSPHALRTECIVKQIDKVAVSSQDTVRSRTADTTHSHRVVHVSSQAQKAATTAASVHVSASGQYSVYASQRHHWKLITSLSANIISQAANIAQGASYSKSSHLSSGHSGQAEHYHPRPLSAA